MRKQKSMKESTIVSRYLLMPEHANPAGIAFGGTILSWIDITASMCAMRFAETNVLTVKIDCTNFLKPVAIGDHAIIEASVSSTGNTSLEVTVTVFREHPFTGGREVATTSHLVFVAIDGSKKPTQVPEGI